MTDIQTPTYTCFDGHRRIASGPLHVVALQMKHTLEGGSTDPVLLFDDRTGRSIDIDTRGTDEDVTARHRPIDAEAAQNSDDLVPADEPRGRGRPRLGVVPREVTLLPRHWDWLETQPGGASVALRKLVEAARRTHADKDRIRKAQERAYSFMSAMAGDMPNFEEAARALFANDPSRLSGLIAVWPVDVRDHVIRLASSEEGSMPL